MQGQLISHEHVFYIFSAVLLVGMMQHKMLVGSVSFPAVAGQLSQSAADNDSMQE